MLNIAPGLKMYDKDKSHTIQILWLGVKEEKNEIFYKPTDGTEYGALSMDKEELMEKYYPITPMYAVQAIYLKEYEIIAGDKVESYNVYIAINTREGISDSISVPTLNLKNAFKKQIKDKLKHDWMPLANMKDKLDEDGVMPINAILGGKVLEAVQKTERVYGYLDTNIMYTMNTMIHHITQWLHKNDEIGNSWAELKYPYQEGMYKILEALINSKFEETIDYQIGVISLEKITKDEYTLQLLSHSENKKDLVELLRNIISKTIYKNSKVDINSADIIEYKDNIILDELEKKVHEEGSILIKVKRLYDLMKYQIYLIKFRLIPNEPPLNNEEMAKFMSVKK